MFLLDAPNADRYYQRKFPSRSTNVAEMRCNFLYGEKYEETLSLLLHLIVPVIDNRRMFNQTHMALKSGPRKFVD